jgi:hypothetical protein
MSRHINIILPDVTIQTIDRMAKPGERSRFIDQAVRHTWQIEASRPSGLNWNTPPSVTGTWTGKALLSGVLWIRKHGNNSRKPNHNENQLPEAGRNIPRATRSGVRPGDPEDPADPCHPEQRFQQAERNHNRGADHPYRAVSAQSSPRLAGCGPNTGLSLTSVALLNQIRAVDRMRLIKRLGTVDDATMERVDEAIKISLGFISLGSS